MLHGMEYSDKHMTCAILVRMQPMAIMMTMAMTHNDNVDINDTVIPPILLKSIVNAVNAANTGNTDDTDNTASTCQH